jgi:alkanesulfonate monooxygenase SsuD/methylene tetrahydromethanopterin reductase-like flavin-dependent oxidoreductase (luciferase family)
MKFQVLSLISHAPHPPTGDLPSAADRIELVVGKGAEAGHFDLFGLDEERQWDLQKEKYELLRRLWSEESVDWEGESARRCGR